MPLLLLLSTFPAGAACMVRAGKGPEESGKGASVLWKEVGLSFPAPTTFPIMQCTKREPGAAWVSPVCLPYLHFPLTPCGDPRMVTGVLG